MNEMGRYNFPKYLIRIVAAYLQDRTIKSRGAQTQLTKGCPQGSVLRPQLWNIDYNYVLERLEGNKTHATCYADDTAMVACSQTERGLVKEITSELYLLTELLERAGLRLNAQKTEIIVLHGKVLKNYTPPKIYLNFQGVRLESGRRMKYLGVIMDDRLLWDDHVTHIIEKAREMLPRIIGVCENTLGYSHSARKSMLNGTIGAYFRYASTVFVEAVPRHKKDLEKLHRRMLICSGRMYRTVSYISASVIANEIPLALSLTQFVVKRGLKKGWPIKETMLGKIEGTETSLDIDNRTIQKWQQWWDACRTGRWVRKLINHVGDRTAKLDFYLAQGLSGHRVFREYLFRMHRAVSPLCDCGEEETAEHAVTECRLHAAGRPTALEIKEENTIR